MSGDRFCTGCGKPLNAKERFCTACGAAVGLPARETAALPPDQESQPLPVEAAEGSPVAQSSVGRGFHPRVWHLGVALLLLAGMGAGVAVVVSQSTQGSKAGRDLSVGVPSTGQPQTTSPSSAATSSTTTTGQATTSPSPASPSTGVLHARAFSISTPSGHWVIQLEANKGSYLDSTIVSSTDPNVLIRIDESVGGRTGLTPEQEAAPVIATLRRQSSYVDLGRTRITLLGFPALRLEYTVSEQGVRLHKVDTFFTGSAGNGWGVLIQSPASQWTTQAKVLEVAVESLRLRTSAKQTPAQITARPGPSGRLYAITHDVVMRDGPNSAANAVGRIPSGTMIGVECRVTGQTIDGPFGPDPNWDRVAYNGVTGFVPDEWVDTKQDETDPRKVPLC
jgi:hypothetical protein